MRLVAALLGFLTCCSTQNFEFQFDENVGIYYHINRIQDYPQKTLNVYLPNREELSKETMSRFSYCLAATTRYNRIIIDTHLYKYNTERYVVPTNNRQVIRYDYTEFKSDSRMEQVQLSKITYWDGKVLKAVFPTTSETYACDGVVYPYAF